MLLPRLPLLSLLLADQLVCLSPRSDIRAMRGLAGLFTSEIDQQRIGRLHCPFFTGALQ